MVTFALTVLVLLSPGDELLATSIAAAARTTIGADAVLELRFVAVPPDDAAAVALARVNQAASIALITWSDANHRRGRLRVYDQATAHWVVRELAFAARDPAEEKGRTIGFNLASMLPRNEGAVAKNEPRAGDASDASASARAGAASPATAVRTAAGVATASSSAANPAAASPSVTNSTATATNTTASRPTAASPAVTSAPPASARAKTAAETASGATHAPAQPDAALTPPRRFAVDAAAQGVVAVSGEGTSAGGALGGQYLLGEHFSVCARAALRLGHIEALEARMVAIDFGAGVAWRSGDVDGDRRRWALQLRIDGFARVQSVRREPAGSRPSESHSRVVPGVGVGVELTYALTREFALLANTSANAVLGETDVFFRGQHVAAFAPVELGLGLGARVYF